MKRPYECKVPGCDKAYTTRFSLRRHIASHSATKQHVCVLCFKTFTLAQYLKEHMYIHTQQKPFKCDYPGCTRAFRQAGKLSMHKKVHQNIIFSIQKVKRNRLSCSDNSCSHKHELALVKKTTVTIKSPRLQQPHSSDDEEEKQQVDNVEEKKDVYIGEETENELSLSRHDDSDISQISHSVDHQEAKQLPQIKIPRVNEMLEKKLDSQNYCKPEIDANNMIQTNQQRLIGMQQNSQIAAVDCKMDSDSESVEDSQMDQSSEFDEAALRKEEQIKLAQMFENQDKRVAINSSSKVKLPYEMLINKLIDSLDTHELTINRQLPVPKGFKKDVVAPKKQNKIDKQASQNTMFSSLYSRAATATSENLIAAPTLKMQTMELPKKQQIQQLIQPQQLQIVQLQAAGTSIGQKQPSVCYQIPQLQMISQQGQPLQLVQLVPVPIQLQPVNAKQLQPQMLVQYTPAANQTQQLQQIQ